MMMFEYIAEDGKVTIDKLREQYTMYADGENAGDDEFACFYMHAIGFSSLENVCHVDEDEYNTFADSMGPGRMAALNSFYCTEGMNMGAWLFDFCF